MISSLMSRMAQAQNLDVNQLKQAVQDGTLPAYVGVPLIQDKMKQQQMAQAGKSQPAQPPIADQILAQADQKGIDSAPSNLQSMSGGGIAYAAGGDVDSEDQEDQQQELEDQQDLQYAQMMSENAEAAPQGISALPQAAASPVAQVAQKPTAVNQTPEIKPSVATDKDQARKYNVGNLRPSGFTYKGQIGVSPGGFALFDSPEAGAAALHQDIGAKLKRGVDTPEKFIEIYAPRKSKGGDNPDKVVDSYIENVAKSLGIARGDKIPNTPEARQALHDAIVKQEGSQYATAHFAEGGIADIPRFNGDTPVGSQVPTADPNATTPADPYANNPYMQRVLANQAAVSGITDGGIGELFKAKNWDPVQSSYRAVNQFVMKPWNNFINQSPEEQAVIDNIGKEARTGQRPMFTNTAADTARDQALMAQAKEKAATRIAQEKASKEAANTPQYPIDNMGEYAKQTGIQSLPASNQFNVEPTNNTNPTREEMQPSNLAAPKEKSDWEKYMDQLGQSREDLKSQKAEDKYLAIMAAGLGTLKANNTIEPGKVHSGLGDTGAGALEGLAYYANASKQRQAQENAIDKAQGLAMYRDQVAKNAAIAQQNSLANKGIDQELHRDALNEQKKQHAQTNLFTATKLLEADWKNNLDNATKSEAEKNAYIYSHPLVRQAAQEAGLDLSSLGPKAPPVAGEVRGGFKFKGGNPNDKSNWEQV